MIGQQWLGMVEGSREARGVTSMALVMVAQQVSTDSGLAMEVSTDLVWTGQGNTGRVGEVFQPILLVQPSLQPGTIGLAA